MEARVFLCGVKIPPLCYEPLSDKITRPDDKGARGECALELSLLWAKDVALSVGQGAITIICSQDDKGTIAKYVEMLEGGTKGLSIHIEARANWGTRELLKYIALQTTGSTIVGFINSPFMDIELTKKLLEQHIEYKGEYTFAQCYPKGLSPIVIDNGSAAIMAQELKGEDTPIKQDSIFNAIVSNINSYEIESIIALEDYRLYRLDFTCDKYISYLACKNILRALRAGDIKNIDASSIASYAIKDAKVLCTVPYFYNIQIATREGKDNKYSPYGIFLKDRLSKGKGELKDMDIGDFKGLLAKIVEYSREAVIGLSLWGEPLCHLQFIDFMLAVMEYPSLTVLVETDGIAQNKERIEELVAYEERIIWVVKASYSEKALEVTAKETVVYLRAMGFSRVYPEFLRTKENEESLEAFYKLYHPSDSPSQGKLTIQKYDSFCKLLPELKSADLAPLDRYPCWHLRRELAILSNGDVPICREQGLEAKHNAFKEDLNTIWQANIARIDGELKGDIPPKCRDCDEWYIYNF